LTSTKAKKNSKLPKNLLIAITVEGFKSIGDRRSMPLSMLNVIAGINSSGKSSFMQPLLLLKQTMEAPYDPGPLLINGPNVKFTELDQFFSQGLKISTQQLMLGLTYQDQSGFEIHLGKDAQGNLTVLKNVARAPNEEISVTPVSQSGEMSKWIEANLYQQLSKHFKGSSFIPERDRCFIDTALRDSSGRTFKFGSMGRPSMNMTQKLGLNVLHVPGLRGQPDRRYQNSAVGEVFPGRMDDYVASIIADWQEKKDARLQKLSDYLKQLGLTWTVQSKKLDATSVEIKVGRMPTALKGGAKDLVSIADVGFGVSQVLPVLVALLVARAGQLVYIEQPEIHLHPKAQRALAHVFADAVVSGHAQIVVETHSALFLREIQTLVAKAKLDKSLVKLHWVTRNIKGNTEIATCDLDDSGAYGDWPQDFDETESQAATDYYEAAEAVLMKS
jgi:predicted ATPase